MLIVHDSHIFFVSQHLENFLSFTPCPRKFIFFWFYCWKLASKMTWLHIPLNKYEIVSDRRMYFIVICTEDWYEAGECDGSMERSVGSTDQWQIQMPADKFPLNSLSSSPANYRVTAGWPQLLYFSKTPAQKNEVYSKLSYQSGTNNNLSVRWKVLKVF